jgi:DinB superfamily
MAPADLLRPLEGQREDTLQVVDSIAEDDLDAVVRGDGRTVRQVLCHLVDREHGINFAISRALAGEIVRLSQEERDEIVRSELEPAPSDWGIDRIRSELLEAREALRRTFLSMTEEDLYRPIRWPEWSARSIRTSIPYMLEHEDSHLDELREALPKARAS